MRTAQQIENLRHVLASFIGIHAYMLSDYHVDFWANHIQGQINDRVTWHTKIRFLVDDRKWEEIEQEPKAPHVSFGEISTKCYNLLEKYDSIKEIKIYNDRGRSYVFNREQLQPA